MNSNVAFLGTGAALPSQRVATAHYEEVLGFEPGKLLELTGVNGRYVCEAESQIDLAVSSINQAIQTAGIDKEDIDLIISACGVGYQTLPSTAPLVMSKLGMKDGGAAAFDINSTCLSFLSGVEMAQHLLGSGAYKTALIFSSEIASRALPWETAPQTAAIFGDGAAAVVLGHKKQAGRGMVASVMRTYPSAYEACSIAAGGTRFDFQEDNAEFARHTTFSMDGKALFRIATKHLKNVFDELLEKAGWTLNDVDIVIPHQASPIALQHMIDATGLKKDRVIDISRDYGNQIAASIPFAFDTALRNDKIKAGSKLLFFGTSAGVSIGGIAWEM